MKPNAFSLSQLCDDLRESCQVRAGDVVIIHSSARSVGQVENGAKTIAQAIQEAVGPEGTVLVPAFSSPQPDGIFDLRRTPSRVGYITECFRTDPASIRSKHPTHSVVAWGRQAAEFTAGHEQTTALGPDSPLHKAAKAGASILMIGCDLTACSLVHVAEAMVRSPYLGKVFYPQYDRTLTLIGDDGVRHEYPPVDVPGDSAGFRRVQNEMDRRDLIERGRLGLATVMRLNAKACLCVAIELLKLDSAALLCDRLDCPVCPPARRIIAQHQATEKTSPQTRPAL